MRYISKITLADGRVHETHCFYPGNTDFSIILNEDGHESAIAGCDVIPAGLATPIDSVYGVAIETPKSLRLYDYAKIEAGTRAYLPSDICRLTTGGGSTSIVTRDKNELLFEFEHGGLYLYDKIFVYHYGGVSTTFNLYDMLGYFCRGCRHNLMKYDTIYFRNSITPTKITLRFDHSAKAERFYAKMLLDVMKDVVY